MAKVVLPPDIRGAIGIDRPECAVTRTKAGTPREGLVCNDNKTEMGCRAISDPKRVGGYDGCMLRDTWPGAATQRLQLKLSGYRIIE